MLALREAEQVVEALNEAIALEDSPHDKARFLMVRLQKMLGGDADLDLFVQGEVTRDPAPIVLDRISVGPTYDRFALEPKRDLQQAFDEAAPALRQIVPDALRHLRTPRTFLLSEDIADRRWFNDVKIRRLLPRGWDDVLASHWAASEDRLVTLALLLRKDQPRPSPEARRLVSLMLRAIAPIVDREMFQGLEAPPVEAPAEALLEGRALSERQSDVLQLLLRGMSEKEVARQLGVSTHTVHTHVKKLYAEFEVSSRGELLARFVDQRVLKLMA